MDPLQSEVPVLRFPNGDICCRVRNDRYVVFSLRAGLGPVFLTGFPLDQNDEVALPGMDITHSDEKMHPQPPRVHRAYAERMRGVMRVTGLDAIDRTLITDEPGLLVNRPQLWKTSFIPDAEILVVDSQQQPGESDLKYVRRTLPTFTVKEKATWPVMYRCAPKSKFLRWITVSRRPSSSGWTARHEDLVGAESRNAGYHKSLAAEVSALLQEVVHIWPESKRAAWEKENVEVPTVLPEFVAAVEPYAMLGESSPFLWPWKKFADWWRALAP